MARYSSAKKAAAAAAWRHIFDYIVATAPERVAVLERLGLTPAESRALISLDPDAGRSMRSLADEWSNDHPMPRGSSTGWSGGAWLNESRRMATAASKTSC